MNDEPIQDAGTQEQAEHLKLEEWEWLCDPVAQQEYAEYLKSLERNRSHD